MHSIQSIRLEYGMGNMTVQLLNIHNTSLQDVTQADEYLLLKLISSLYLSLSHTHSHSKVGCTGCAIVFESTFKSQMKLPLNQFKHAEYNKRRKNSLRFLVQMSRILIGFRYHAFCYSLEKFLIVQFTQNLFTHPSIILSLLYGRKESFNLEFTSHYFLCRPYPI